MARDLGRDLALDLRLGLALDQSPDRATMKVRRSSARAQQMRTPRPTAVTANNQDNRASPSQAPASSSFLAADKQRCCALQGFVGALAWISRRYTPISIGPSQSEIPARKSRPPQS